MQVSRTVRFTVLGLVAVLAAGLFWLGLNRYMAEKRALAAAQLAPDGVTPPAGDTATPVKPDAPPVVVHVAGAVAVPGVYRLDRGARVADAIAAAGGALPEGVPDELNLADKVNDGDKIYVYTRQELQAVKVTPAAPPPSPVPLAQNATKPPVTSTKATAPSAPAAGPAKVNINTATAAELDKVKWVTPTQAKAVVDYRTKNGPFTSLDDLKRIKGFPLDKAREYLTL